MTDHSALLQSLSTKTNNYGLAVACEFVGIILGILTLFSGIIAGGSSHEFDVPLMLIYWIGGGISSLALFALGRILSIQNDILNRMARYAMDFAQDDTAA